MNKLYCLLIMFIVCRICSGQNLVPNASFEDTVQCPATSVQNFIDLASSWYSARVSPNYFNTSVYDSIALWDVPRNGFGYQQPATGNAYAGLYTYGNPSGGSADFREFIECQLTSPLVIGQKYFVSFKVVSGRDGFYYGTHWTSNKLGAFFTTYFFYTNDLDPLQNFAHIYSDSVITDTLNWTIIKGSFIADSAYQYMSLGNFFDQFNTTAIVFGSIPSLGAFYYIDDVCVSTDSLCGSPQGLQGNTNNETITFSPNPFDDKINITAKRNELLEVSLYDITARKILKQSFTNSTSINTQQIAKGIYLYEVRNKSGMIKQGKVVKD